MRSRPALLLIIRLRRHSTIALLRTDRAICRVHLKATYSIFPFTLSSAEASLAASMRTVRKRPTDFIQHLPVDGGLDLCHRQGTLVVIKIPFGATFLDHVEDSSAIEERDLLGLRARSTR